MTSPVAFLESCRSYPDRAAVIDAAGETLTYGQLSQRSARLAQMWQQRGLAKGDRVLLAMPVGTDLYVSLAALWRLGAVVVFPEPALGLYGLRHAVRTAAPKAFLATGWYRWLRVIVPGLWRVPMSLNMREQANADASGALTPAAADDPALISFTSGSTGAPKAILRTHGLLAAQNAAVRAFLQPDAETSVDLVAFPVFVLANLALGITSVLPNWNVRKHDQADPDAIAAHIAATPVSRILVPPSICEALLRTSKPPPLRAIFTGGGPVYPDLVQRLNAAFPDTRFIAVYGSTEAEPIAHVASDEIDTGEWERMESGAGLLAGHPVPETDVRIHNDEIVVTGGHVNKGYLDPAHDASTKMTIDGRIWHRTGDAGYLDEEGRLWLLGRLDGRSGGLFPFAIELAARTWPGVSQAALSEVDGRAILALTGDRRHEADWRAQAQGLGDLKVCVLDQIPLDRRHRSKVDYPTLRKRLARVTL